VALKFGKKHRQMVADVLEADHESLENAVEAVLDLAEELIAERASWVVVGQLYATRERPSVPPSDPEAIKVALGFYSTEGDARSAAESLWTSSSTGDQYRVWWMPLFHGTPAELHKQQKEKYQAAAEKTRAAQSERIQKQIEQRRLEAQQRADAARGEQAA
jgi:hypothetical protein